MEFCVACSEITATNRRKLYSDATRHVVPVLCEIASKVYPGSSVIPSESEKATAYLCKACFRSVEKLIKLRQDAVQLEAAVADSVRRVGDRLGVERACTSESSDVRLTSRKRPATALEDSPASRWPAKKRRQAPNTPCRLFLEQTIAVDSPAVAVVESRRGGKGRVNRLTRSLKRIGRSVGRQNRKSIARQVVADTVTRTHIVDQLGKVIDKEMRQMCSLKVPSILRGSDPNVLRTFSWSKVIDELKSVAPTLLRVLQSCVSVKEPPSKRRLHKKTVRPKGDGIIGLCAAIVLRHRNQSMNLVQRVLSLVLYSGHSSKMVFTRLQKLHLCLSHFRSINYIDKLGEGHDTAVHLWRARIEQHMFTPPELEIPVCGVTQPNVISESHGDSETLTEGQQLRYSSSDSFSLSGTNSVSAPSCSPLSSPSSTISSSDECELPEDTPMVQAEIPSFKIVGDNIDKTVRPREMRIDHQSRSLHYFHLYGVRDRVSVDHLHDEAALPDLKSVNVKEVLPTTQDEKRLRENFAFHIACILKRRSKFFAEFGSGLQRHIKHDKYNEMATKSEVVPLGILLKSETKYEDMVDILEHTQQYVPGSTTECEVDVPQRQQKAVVHLDQFLIGGDQLTAARARGSKRIRHNEERGKDRLEGLMPVVEDWHAKMCFLEVIWKRLYDCSSAANGGSLFQLRNLINRRNVVKHPSSDVNACQDFFLLVTEAHIIAAVMTVFRMKSIDDEPPSSELFPKGCKSLDPEQRRSVMMLAITQVVNEFVDVSYGSDGEADKEHSDDLVLSYACESLTLGLFLMEFIDAIREGDGLRIVRCWRYFLLLFKTTGRTNYSVEAFTLLAQLHFIFTPRMAHQLVWSRTVNTHGRPGKNIPCDLHMEHLNRDCKTAIAGLGANITDKAVQRVGRCVGEMVNVTDNYDREHGICPDSGRHSSRSSAKDLEKLVDQLVQTSKVFEHFPERKHTSFRNFKKNSMQTLDMLKCHRWMNERLRKLIDFD